MSKPRDHGGGLDAAVATFGGRRSDWLDLSTGINPHPYPLPGFPADILNSLPDTKAGAALEAAARHFWNAPRDAAVLAAPGASALIARIPYLTPAGCVDIPEPTYNEHAAAFLAAGWRKAPVQKGRTAARVAVHPNNPDGRFWHSADLTENALTVIDESFCDIAPDASHIALAARKNTLVLKSFGKFWGLAGLRLGFAIGDPELVGKLAEMLGPWPVSGPAMFTGTIALRDDEWATSTRTRLASDAARLDDLMRSKGAAPIGGTSLFRLYEVDTAARWQTRLAQLHIWSRIFPYSKTWLRLGLPPTDRWDQLENAL